MNIINLYQLSGILFKKILYIDINNLKEILNELLQKYNSNIYIQLLLNNIIINNGTEENNFNFYNIHTLESLNDSDIIQIIFIAKNEIFTENINGICSLNKKFIRDKYYKLLNTLIKNGYNKYEFINNSEYKNLVLIAITNKFSLLNISQDLQNDKDIVIAAVSQSGLMLQYTNDIMKNDKDVVLAAIKSSPVSLIYASLNIKDDKDIILIAVSQFGYLLKYASTNLQNDKDVVLAAVEEHGNALLYASNFLKNDIDVILKAASESFYSLCFINEELLKNKYIQKAINEENLSDLEFFLNKIKNI